MTSRLPKFELSPDQQTVTVSGRICDFGDDERFGGPAERGWTERITREAFQYAFSEQPDVHLLINQEGFPLARTKSRSLHLTLDDFGVVVHATVPLHPEPYAPGREGDDVFRTQTRQLLRAKQFAERPDGEQLIILGFSYQVIDQEWSNDYQHRLITKLSLKRGAVSIDTREAVQREPATA